MGFKWPRRLKGHVNLKSGWLCMDAVVAAKSHHAPDVLVFQCSYAGGALRRAQEL